MALHTQSLVTLRSSSRALEQGFDRIKRQALHWVFEGYPVGDYYEAALPNRDAFCMRDTSHQCTGAEVLGLSSHNLNMFRKFAASMTEARDYCALWEIDRYDRPCPVDWTNDSDFWFNLPANFDMLHALWRMYEWTGDERYLTDRAIDEFCARTVEDYIARWDRDGDGLPDRRASEGRRGLASYDESDYADDYLVGCDLLAAMARAHLSYSSMCRAVGRREQAAIYGKRGEKLMRMLHDEWYQPGRGYASALGTDRKLMYSADQHYSQFLLYWDAAGELPRARECAEYMVKRMDGAIIESLSHYPELLWRYGRPAEALKALERLMDPNCYRKEYPEASFSAVGAVATGMIGIRPERAGGDGVVLPDMGRVTTRAALAGIDWVELDHVPVLGGEISVRHDGDKRTLFTRENGEKLTWRAAFEGECAITIDGKSAAVTHAVDEFSGKAYTYADVEVQSGVEHVAERA